MPRSYSEKLLDPRWQKRRLEILDDRNWACESCSSTEKTLHVHHGYYRKWADPWDYPDDVLWVLCLDCHKEAEDARQDVYEQLASLHPRWLIGLDAFNYPPGHRAPEQHESLTLSLSGLHHECGRLSFEEIERMLQ